MLTAVATTPNLQRPGVRDSGGRPSDYICHVFTAAIPVSEVRRLIGLDGPITDRVQLVLRDIGVLTLEGTNFTTALQRELPAYYPRTVAEDVAEKKYTDLAVRETVVGEELSKLPSNLPAISTLQRAPTMGDFSRFYRWVVSAWLPLDDAVDLAIVDDNFGNPVYGQTMQDFVEMSKPSVRWMPVYKVTSDDIAAMDRLLSLQPPLKPLPGEEPAPPISDENWQAVQALAGPYVAGDKPLWPDFVGYRLQHVNQLTGARVEELRVLKRRGFRIAVRWYGIADDINLIGLYLWPPPSSVSEAAIAAIRQQLP